MSEPSESCIYEFDDFRLNAKSHRLYRRGSGELVRLTPKAIELLICLAVNSGKILTKDELLEKVWTDSIVEESNLSQTIFILRKTLGENTKEPRFIRTIPNRGYQFIAAVSGAETHAGNFPIEELPGAARRVEPPLKTQARNKMPYILGVSAAIMIVIALGVYIFRPSLRPATLTEIRSIAILPFEDLSTEPNDKYLGASLADALVNKISGIRQISVRPTRSVSRYSEGRDDTAKIGRELQVDAVLDGRIQHLGDRVRVSVQLVRTSDNVTIWSDNFDDAFTNLFSVQDSISRKVVQSLALQLDDREREKLERRGTENPEAYEDYLRGRFFWNKRTAEGLEKATEYFRKATEIDPGFAEGYSALAETYVLVNLFGVHHDPNAFPMAKAAAEKALQLNENLADAHAALAQVKMQYDFDWVGTESEYLKAIELNPNNATVRQWYGEFLALQSRTDEGTVQIEKARELDPTSLSTNNALALPLMKANEPDKALAVTAKVLEMDANFPWALHYSCRAYMIKGDLVNAVDLCRKALSASNQSIFMRSNLGYVLARAGHTEEARQILAGLQDAARTGYVSPYNLAMIHNGLGERDAAIKYLNQAVDEHDFLIPALQTDSFFLNLHADPRFLDVLRRVNL